MRTVRSKELAEAEALESLNNGRDFLALAGLHNQIQGDLVTLTLSEIQQLVHRNRDIRTNTEYKRFIGRDEYPRLCANVLFLRLAVSEKDEQPATTHRLAPVFDAMRRILREGTSHIYYHGSGVCTVVVQHINSQEHANQTIDRMALCLADVDTSLLYSIGATYNHSAPVTTGAMEERVQAMQTKAKQDLLKQPGNIVGIEC